MTYAKGTSVDVAKSRAEIDALLTKRGASSVAILNDTELHRAAIAFSLKGSRFRIEVPLQTIEDVNLELKKSRPTRWSYWGESQRNGWRAERLTQLHRERWRAVLLLIKSKLAVVDIGLSTVEKEFLADMILPNGKTVEVIMAEVVRRGLAEADMPRLLTEGDSP